MRAVGGLSARTPFAQTVTDSAPAHAPLRRGLLLELRSAGEVEIPEAAHDEAQTGYCSENHAEGQGAGLLLRIRTNDGDLPNGQQREKDEQRDCHEKPVA